MLSWSIVQLPSPWQNTHARRSVAWAERACKYVVIRMQKMLIGQILLLLIDSMKYPAIVHSPSLVTTLGRSAGNIFAISNSDVVLYSGSFSPNKRDSEDHASAKTNKLPGKLWIVSPELLRWFEALAIQQYRPFLQQSSSAVSLAKWHPLPSKRMSLGWILIMSHPSELKMESTCLPKSGRGEVICGTPGIKAQR